MRSRKGERGGGTISAIIWLAVLAAAGYAMFNVGPAYVTHYSLQDKMVELCRLGRSQNPDQKILDALMKRVNEEGLGPYIVPSAFVISTDATSRRISVEYDRELKVLPGMVRNFHFTANAEGLVAF
jgi:hypothetical protein